MTNFLWYLFTFYAVLNFTLFESTNCLQPTFPFRSTIYSSLQMTQTFIILLDSCVLFLENSTCFCLLGPLSYLSNVIHSSSNCVFFLPSHKTFEVKFPLWLKDKVEFLACLNMFTVSPQMKRILFLKFWRKNNSKRTNIIYTIWHFNYSLFCQKQNLISTKITSKIKHKIFLDVMFVLTNSNL